LVADVHLGFFVSATVHLHQALFLSLEKGLWMEALSWLAKRKIHAVLSLVDWVNVSAHADIIVLKRNLGTVNGCRCVLIVLGGPVE
jgi:hypothetical protein